MHECHRDRHIRVGVALRAAIGMRLKTHAGKLTGQVALVIGRHLSYPRFPVGGSLDDELQAS